MILVLGLIGAGVFVGWVIGHYADRQTKTVTVAAGSASPAAPTKINAAPAFSIDDLAADPTDNWITNGGSLSNQRYSPLTEIDDVERLRPQGRVDDAPRSSAARREVLGREPAARLRRRHLRPDRPGRRLRGERRHRQDPLEARGATSTRRSAPSAAAGRAAASRSATARSTSASSTASSSRSTRRRARRSGRRRSLPWQHGYSITGAPLYYRRPRDHRRLRRRVRDPRARSPPSTRRPARRPGASTRSPVPARPATTRGRRPATRGKHGGAPVWQTPSVDPKLGLLYFTTGNAGPDNNGSARAGQEPLTPRRCVALDAKTGQAQVVLPDGSSRHLGLRRAEPDRPLRREDRRQDACTASARPRRPAGSTCLTARRASRSSRSPEKPVPQNAYQKTSPTQPFPSYAPVVPHRCRTPQYAGGREDAAGRRKRQEA